MARRIAVKPAVGHRRLSPGTSGSLSAATRETRKQMEGIRKNYEKLINQIKDVTPEAMVYGLQPVFDKSQYYVPVDKGDLKESGYLQVGVFRGNPQAEIGYARGGKPHYAAYVHEDLEAWHKPPTRAKYLEQALNEHLNDVLPRIREFLRGRGMR